MSAHDVDGEASRHNDHQLYENRPSQETQRVESDDGSAGAPPAPEGKWGERDQGDVDEGDAMDEFEALGESLSRLQRSKTAESQNSNALSRIRTWRSIPGRVASRRTRREADDDLEAGEAGEKGDAGDGDGFDIAEFLREGHFEKRTGDGKSMKQVGVLYKNLSVQGAGSTSSFVRTVPDAVIGTFGPDLYKILCRFIPFLRPKGQPTRTLINDFTGCVRSGEMMLVLGRPGSGCSTFLKAVSNNRDGYAGMSGEVSYGGIPAAEQNKHFRGEVVYNGEDDIHFAMLSVWRTLTFALMNKTKKATRDNIPIIAEALMKMFGISHTKHTQVGDEYVRGVSGGERKRVSIAETLAAKATVTSWDNSTRGLDASTALDYARSLRIMTDVSNRTTLVTLYQAGEGIYETMDKVLVIDEGRQIFSGPANKAKKYFEDLGFECPDRQTTADFLTAVTDPNERRFRPGFEKRAPKTAEELERAFRESPNYQELLEDVASYEATLRETDHADAKRFEEAVQESKSKLVPDRSSYTISFFNQVMISTKRELWLLLSDTTTLYTKLFIIIANGLIVGSLFYGQSEDTSGAFSRGGAAFFSILFLGWLQLSELMKAVSGRAVVGRHRDYAFYRPSSVSVARVLLDFPVVAVMVLIFSVIMYFMTGLTVDVSRFWIYTLFVYTMTMVITALYRMFASVSPDIDTAVRFSGIALNLLIIFTGYVIPKTQLLGQYIWFGWLYHVNPVSYAFEGVLTNEFSGRVMDCSPGDLVPQGPGVQRQYQGCALSGASINAHEVTGDDYLDVTYSYTRSHLWRNWGVLIAWGALYIIVTVLATELLNMASSGGGALLFKKSRKAKKEAKKKDALTDEETGGAGRKGSASTIVAGDGAPRATDTADADDSEPMEQLTESKSIFTWRDLEYTVPYMGGEKKLLNKVNGYARPGVMVALMGASGAGKTTLLNTLAQRQTVGVVSGEMFVDGRELSPDFQRNTGFCLQGDLHDRTQTIREAIEFSAILRQEASVPRAEKIAYVDKIISLLELDDMQDAIIMSLGVEQRKRLTIGVELAAKPSLLLFLDEPTSGLDSQSAYSIVRFLKKLSRAGQYVSPFLPPIPAPQLSNAEHRAIVCTIHQPSSVLIEQFDMVLALNPGGNTFYFGPMGENGQDVVKYFADRGAVCPPRKNVAEFILETAARPHRRPDGTKVDWNEEWRTSPEAAQVIEFIDGLKTTRSRATEGAADDKGSHAEYAAPTWLQCVELTKRMFRQHWRDPSYIYGKLFTSVIVGIFNGFTFWNLGYTIQDMQNRMFTCFLIITVPPTVVNAVVPKFYGNLALWEAREQPSRIYNWVAFCTANAVAEIPWAVVSAFLYWVLWYWPTGLPTQSSVSGYSFLMTLLMFFFMNSWGQWITAFAPNFTVIANVSNRLLIPTYEGEPSV